jgi:hypothetical protein
MTLLDRFGSILVYEFALRPLLLQSDAVAR